jgi:hypothetical protein
MGAVPPACCTTAQVQVGSDSVVVAKPSTGLNLSLCASRDDKHTLDSLGSSTSTSAEPAEDDVASNSTTNWENWIPQVVRGDRKASAIFSDITNRPSKESTRSIAEIDAGDLMKVHSAVRWGKTIEELRAAGLTSQAVANMVDDDNGNTALHIAVQNGHLEIARYLVNDLNCWVNATNRAGNSALHMGVEYDFYKINRILVEAGADYAIENNEGHPAIQGISGTKIGKNAWNNPVTILKTIEDDVYELDRVFALLETWPAGDIKKEELVRVGLARKRDIRAWMEGNFQSRFVRIVAKF